MTAPRSDENDSIEPHKDALARAICDAVAGAERVVKPPLGLRPRFIVAEHRVREIDEAIQRFAEAGWAVPQAWTDERVELVEWLGQNTRHPIFPSGKGRGQ